MIEQTADEAYNRDLLTKADYRIAIAKAKMKGRIKVIDGEDYLPVSKVIRLMEDGVTTSRMTEIIDCLKKCAYVAAQPDREGEL